MKFYTRRRVSPVITIVSLVDILTMVLMFFVYTTTFKTAQEQVKIVLPTVSHSGTATADITPIVLAVNKAGEVFLDNQPIEVNSLADAVKNLASGGRAVQMRADADANFGKVMEVLDVLQGIGIKDVSTMTQQKK